MKRIDWIDAGKDQFFTVICAGVLAAASMGLSMPIAAQTPVATAPASGLEEITVTARRTAEKLQDVPVAVAAISAEELADEHITTQADLQFATPGLTVRETGSSDQLNYSIRGQSIDAFSFASPAVVTYFNEVPIGGGAASQLFDLEAIQVLKGPQGTLFGRNATGGAVLYGAKKPTSDFEADATVDYGNYNDEEIEAALTLPIASGIAVRIAGKTQNRGGYEHNVLLNTWVDSIDSRVGRVSLLIAPPGSGFENVTMVQQSKDGGYVGQDKMLNANGVNGAPSTYFDPLTGTTQPLIANMANLFPAGVVVSGPNSAYINSQFGGVGNFLIQQAKAGFYDLWTNSSDLRNGSGTLVTNTTTYQLGEQAQIKNIYGYNYLLHQEQSDIEGDPYTFLGVGGNPGQGGQGYTFQTNQWSEELQVNGKAGAIKYIAGAYVSQEQDFTGIPLTLYPQLPAVPGAGPIGAYNFTTYDKSKALYGQLTYGLTSGLNLTGGLRYTWEDVSILQSANSDLAFLNGGIGSRKDAKPSWLVGIDYKITPDLMIYFNQRGSWRTGGFNGTSAASAPNAATFKPETTYDFEFGAKYAGTLRDVPTRVNIAIYNQIINNVQRAPYLNISALAGNVDQATVTGVEFDSSFKLTHWFEIGGAFTYTDARYTNPHATVAGASFYFGPYADTPKESGSVYFRLSTDLPQSKGELAFRAQLYAQGYFYYSNLNNTIVPGCEIPGYSLTNVRAEWNNLYASKFNAALFANNVLNRDYYSGGFPLGAVTGENSAIPGTPRMFGVELSAKF